MMEIDKLIADMQEVKAAHSNLTIDQILKMFTIQAMGRLTSVIGSNR